MLTRGVILAAVLAAAMPPALQAVDDGCLSCLCQAATGCDANRDCDGATCGMFAISRQYWKDAGEPGGGGSSGCTGPAGGRSHLHLWLIDFLFIFLRF